MYVFALLVALNAILQPNVSEWLNYAALAGLWCGFEWGAITFPVKKEMFKLLQYVLLNSVLMLRVQFPWILMSFQIMHIPASFIPSILLSIPLAGLPLVWRVWLSLAFASVFYGFEFVVSVLYEELFHAYTDGKNLYLGYIKNPPKHLTRLERGEISCPKLGGLTICFFKDRSDEPCEESDDSTESDKSSDASDEEICIDNEDIKNLLSTLVAENPELMNAMQKAFRKQETSTDTSTEEKSAQETSLETSSETSQLSSKPEPNQEPVPKPEQDQGPVPKLEEEEKDAVEQWIDTRN
jgi:hypothetical protein